ncbi:glycosyltransferase family 2 protein [Thermithiobacillus plumbiphilus]|uniref:Glycosyltransferase family 2 protein n=1 Tax=Thermithiobacillus plumbiphilus TaxID=1729899 RepID=A0ABU9DBA2_9PROT
MSSNKLLSIAVVISTYNRPEALDEVLKALSMQSRLPDEVIIADDGSGPATRNLVEQFPAPFLLKHVWHPDEGFRLAAIRNRAIEVAQAEYLIFLDGDCLPLHHFVEDHARYARKGRWSQGKRILTTPKGVEKINAETIDSKFHLLLLGARGFFNHPHRLLHIPEFPAHVKKSERGVRGCNMGMWYEDVLKVKGFDEAYVGWGLEDSDLAVRLSKIDIVRQDLPFAGQVIHLWHPEHPRHNLEEKKVMLNEIRRSDRVEARQGVRSSNDV